MSGNPPSFIQYKGWNFLITDAPSSDALDAYIKVLKAHNVHNVVRACDPSYDAEKLRKKKIDIHVRFESSIIIFQKRKKNIVIFFSYFGV